MKKEHRVYCMKLNDFDYRSAIGRDRDISNFSLDRRRPSADARKTDKTNASRLEKERKCRET